MVLQVKRWGNSLAVRLPRTIAAEAGVTEGTPVEVTAAGGVVRIEKVTERPAYRLEELVRGITPRNRHELAEPDGPVGREVW